MRYPIMQLIGSFGTMAIAGIVFLLVAKSSKVAPRKKVLVMVMCLGVCFGATGELCGDIEGAIQGYDAEGSDGRPQPTPTPLFAQFKDAVESDFVKGLDNAGSAWSNIGESIEEAWKDVPNSLSGEIYDAIGEGLTDAQKAALKALEECKSRGTCN